MLKTEKNIKVNSEDKPYSKLALIYDGVMEHVNYARWADYILKISDKYISGNASVLELAAGNCRIADIIHRKYNNIIASDISFDMLNSSANDSVLKVCCDMLKLPFINKFDFIYSTFDSVNYLTSKRDLNKLFNQINSVISDEGIFTFDVSMERNSLSDEEFNIFNGKFNGYSYRRVSRFNKFSKIHKNIFYITDVNGVTVKEVHKQKIYDFKTYFEVIENAGLRVLRCLDCFSFNTGSPDSERLQFITGR